MLVELGQGWWLERREGLVRLTQRGLQSWEWPEEQWADIIGRLQAPGAEPEAPDRNDQRVWHLASRKEGRTLCQKDITPRTLMAEAPGRWLCFSCDRRRRG